MDRERFKQRLKVELDQMADRLANEASEALEDMAAMERTLYAACDALKAKSLQAWIDHAGETGPRPVCPHCGGRLRQKEKVPRTSAAVGGQVTVARTRWRCNACGASFFPSGPDHDGGLLSDHAGGGPAGGGGDG